MAHNSLAKQT